MDQSFVVLAFRRETEQREQLDEAIVLRIDTTQRLRCSRVCIRGTQFSCDIVR